jgi:hypothetical protein
MPVLLTMAPENNSGQLDGFFAPDMALAGSFYPEHSRMHYYKDNIWARTEDKGLPLTNFANPWPADVRVYWDSHEQIGLSLPQTHGAQMRGGHTTRMAIETPGRHMASTSRHGRDPGFHGKHDERSHASSDETLLYPDDFPNNVPSAEDDDSDGIVADGAELEKIYEEYLVEGAENIQGEIGVTIMLQDIPYRMQVEPHVFDLLQSISDLNHVDYIYLPMTTATKRSPDHGSDAARNKGYCFIHFSNNASAQLFVSRLENYVFPTSVFTAPSKTMNAGLAKFQGLSLNLRNLLDIHSKKWRPKNGNVYIRRAGGKLATYGLLRLRNLLKARCRGQRY